MPEIAEVGRIVHYLRKTLVGKTLKLVKAQDDANVFGKVGTSGAAFEKALQGKKVAGAGQQGKYFWLLMDSPPHPVFHFGMTGNWSLFTALSKLTLEGWFHIKGEPVAHYRPRDTEEEVWPPKYWKFMLETEEPKVEAAFTDARRFARIRLVDCAAEDIRKTTPLKENGPDPVIDRDDFTEEWFVKKMNSKHVPVKALLLDQANISGIGNWVGDEILYNAKLHPEQYSDTFSAEQLKQLHASIIYVCKTATDVLADSSKFPDTWLFKHRWGKGKKDAPTSLPTGEKITFLTVGGRTSCVVPSVQKKTGKVAGDIKTNGSDGEDGEKTKTKKGGKAKKDIGDDLAGSEVKVESKPKKRKKVVEVVDEDTPEDETIRAAPLPKTTKSGGRKVKSEVVDEDTPEDETIRAAPLPKTTKNGGRKIKSEDAKVETVEEDEPKQKRRKAATKSSTSKGMKTESTEIKVPAQGQRRSGRNSKA